MRTTAAIPVARRVSGFVYAIRNIVAEARKVEAAGKKVRYLNIGDPITFGFKTPPHMIEAVERAMRDGHNGYAPSVGILPAREAVAAELSRRGMPVNPDRVLITSGTSEGIELTLTALAEGGDEVLVPLPTYPLYTAVLAKIGARPVFYRKDPANGWLPDVRRDRAAGHARDARARRHRSQQPDRRDLSRRCAPRADRDRRPAQHSAARRRGLRRSRLRRPGAADGQPLSRRADHFVLVALEGLPRARMARRLDGGGAHRSARRCARRGEEARGRPALLDRTDGIRDPGGAERRSLARGGLPRRAARARGADHRRV